MTKLIRHIKRWNIWRKHNANGRLHHLLVLFNIIKSPTFGFVFLDSDFRDWNKAIEMAGSSPEEVLIKKTIYNYIKGFIADVISKILYGLFLAATIIMSILILASGVGIFVGWYVIDWWASPLCLVITCVLLTIAERILEKPCEKNK